MQFSFIRLNNIILIFLLFTIANSFAQTGNAYYFKSYDNQKGIVTQYNNFYLKDSYGLEWISSTEGLNCFDGQRTKVYKKNANDSTSLYDDNIQSPLFEDKNGDIWFCTYRAIHVYRRKKDAFDRYWIEENGEKIEKDYYIFDLDTEGYLWLRLGSWKANPQLYKFDTRNNNANKNSYFKVSDFNGARSKVLIDKNSWQKFILTYPSSNGFGLMKYQYQNGNYKFQNYFTGKNSKLKTRIKSILQVNNNDVWIASEIGLIKIRDISNFTFEIYNEYNSLRIKNVLGLVEWRDNYLIVLTQNDGLFFFDKTKNTFISQINFSLKNRDKYGLCSDKYDVISIDNKENLWLTSSIDACISQINLKKIKFSILDNVVSNIGYEKEFSVISQDSSHNIWVGNHAGGATILNNQKKIIKTIPDNTFPEKKIRKIITDKQKNVWLHTDHNIYVFRNLTLVSHEATDYYINDIGIINDRVAVTTSKGLFSLYVTDTKIVIQSIDIKDNNLFNFHQSYSSNILFENKKDSISIYDNKTWKLINNLPLKDDIYCYFQNIDSVLWLGCYNGLYKIVKQKNDYSIRLVKDIHNVWGIVSDNTDNLWCMTDAGLYRFNIKSETLYNFKQSEGLNSKIFKGITKISNGEIWLTSANHIYTFCPEDIKPYDNPPQIHITSIRTDDKEYRRMGNPILLQHINLPHSEVENTLDFSLVAVEFADSDANRLKYKMEGIDKEWIDTTNIKHVASYQRLNPGKYKLRVTGFNCDGIQAEKERTLSIRIFPSWYESWWAVLAFLCCIVALGKDLFDRRLDYEDERKRQKRKILTSEMKALRAQMNPHFLSNAMNAINDFVLKSDAEEASQYLSDFSRLVRSVLNASKVETHSLDKEVEILRGYIDLERLRFSKKFDADIIVGEDVDEWEASIPSMLIQPFVENAINHGLRHKKNGRGRLLVHFSMVGEDCLRCVVTDNGVGRDRAKEINEKDTFKPPSLGLQITKDRIDILNVQRKHKSQLLVEDLFDDNGIGSGTKVTLEIGLW